jgi:nucleoside-diphosphate-sugar epimerase
MDLIVVTGATGFLGRRVVEQLRSEGSAAVPLRAADGTGRVDISNAAEVEAAFSALPGRPSVVVHLAAIAHRRAAAAEYQAVNLEGTRHVLTAALRHHCDRFVLASSATVYGPVVGGYPVHEDAACNPVGWYAVTKLEAERLLLAADGIDNVILRFPAIYARERLDDIRKRAYLPMTGNRVQLHLNGDAPSYSLCALESAAEAVVAAATLSLAAGTYNVADERAYPQPEVASIITGMDGHRPAVRVRARTLKRIVAGGALLLPHRLRQAVHVNLSKLVDGLVLDTSRLAAGGLAPGRDLGLLIGNTRI